MEEQKGGSECEEEERVQGKELVVGSGDGFKAPGPLTVMMRGRDTRETTVSSTMTRFGSVEDLMLDQETRMKGSLVGDISSGRSSI